MYIIPGLSLICPTDSFLPIFTWTLSFVDFKMILNVSIPSTILSQFTETFALPFAALALIIILNEAESKSMPDPRRVQ